MKPEDFKSETRPANRSGTGSPPPPSGISHRVAWLVLVIAFAASIGGWQISRTLEVQAGEGLIATEAAAIRASLRERLSVYENLLHGASGLFSASQSVERHEWQAYVERVSVDDRFPGMDALGYAAYVPRSGMDAFLALTREDGAPGFQIKSGGDLDELLVVTYLEPEDQHRNMLGLDMMTDPARRVITDQCRTSGEVAISSQMMLAEQGGDAESMGFLMLLPLYSHGAATDSAGQREETCLGFVYARFVMRQLMAEVLDRTRTPLQLQLLDRSPQTVESMIFETGKTAPGHEPRLTDEGVVSVGGRTWVLRCASTPEFEAGLSRFGSTMVGAAGVVVSLLLFGIAWSLSHTRERAVAIAAGMTGKLRRSNEQLQREIVDREKAQRSIKDSEALYHSLVESLPMNILRKDMEGRFTFTNQRFCNEVGKALEDILEKTEFDLFPVELAARHKQEDDRITLTGTSLDSVQELQVPDETSRFVQVIKTPLRDGVGDVIGVQAIFWDVTDKHRTEQELQRERDLLHTLLDNVPDRIYFKDDQSRFLRVSSAMADLFKVRDPSEVIGKTDFDFFGELHARQAYEDEQRIIRTGQPVVGLVEQVDLPDGRARWASTTKMPMRDTNGRVIGTFGISRDITEMKQAEHDMQQANERLQQEVATRKRAQQAAMDSEALYYSLVESLPMNILRKDLQGRYTFANQRFCADLGRPLEEILGRTGLEVLPEKAAIRLKKKDDWVIRTGKTLDEVQEEKTGGSNVRYVHVIKTPLKDSAGNVIGLQGVYYDVTDKHRAERALKRERDLLHTLLDNVPDRIYFKDRESRILRISRAHAELFKLKHPREALGKTDFDFFTSEHAQQAFDDEQRIIRTGNPVIGLVEKETLPGDEIRWASTTKMPLRNDAGEIVGTFGITRDITEMKKAAEALLQAKEAAEEANRTKSQFLANMSHELRTPLNSIIGFSNILMKKPDESLGGPRLSFLERILANGKHLLDLINQILDLSKIEARKVDLELESVALDDLVREVLVQMESQLHGKDVQLLSELPEAVQPLRTDATRIKQVLINLVGNALKFTEEGSVTLRLLAARGSGEPIRLDVVDTGVGIPQDKLQTVFEAFAQADGGASRKYGGTGLGLTISKSLCELLGYTIEVQSEVGKGSVFSVVFSQAARGSSEIAKSTDAKTIRGSSADAQTASPAPVPVRSFSNKSVLVIDDEEDARLLMKHLLEELGCKVLTAASGQEGLNLARGSKPDLITTDLLMPEMNGWDVVRSIHADPETCRIPVVVVSVVGSENRGSMVGSVDVLDKPVSRDTLSSLLTRRLTARARVLVVDDDPDALRIVEGYLAETGVQIVNGRNGEEALEVLGRVPVDIIILDLLMPVMDGLTFLSTLQRHAQYREIPVVVLTSKSLSGEERKTLQHHTVKVLRKAECSPEDLKEVLESVWAQDSVQKGTQRGEGS